MDDCRPQREMIAEGPVVQVERCPCGVLHVTLGMFTLRLQEEIVVSLWQTLGEAVQRLSARRLHTCRPQPAAERPS